MGSTGVLERLVNNVKFIAVNLNSALTSYDCDEFVNSIERAKANLENTLKYVEENKEDVSAVLNKREVVKARKKLIQVFKILEDAASAARPPQGYKWLDDFLEETRDILWRRR